MMVGDTVHATHAICGKYVVKVVNLVKCKFCKLAYHLRCAKLLNLLYCDDKTIGCDKMTNSKTLVMKYTQLMDNWVNVSPQLFAYIIDEKE